jgi:hypothetical protein
LDFFAFCLFIFFIKYKPPKIIFLVTIPQFPILFFYFAFFFRLKPKLWIEIRDIWPLVAVELIFLKHNSIFYKTLKILEYIGYKNADIVLTPLLNFRDYINNFKYNFNFELLYFSNGITKENLKTLNIPKNIYESRNFIKIGYFGGLGMSNNILEAINIFSKLENNFEFHIYGDGALKNQLLSFSDNRFIFHNKISQVDAIEKMLDMDFLCLCTPNYDIYKYGLSSLKILDYLIANKPLIRKNS